MDYMAEKGITVDCIITDPPYPTTSRGVGKNTSTGGILKNKEFNSGKPFKLVKIEEYIEKLYKILKDTGHCYIMTNNKNLPHFLSVISNSNFNYFKTLVWDKVSPICNGYYMDRHEYIIFLRRGKAAYVNNHSVPSILSIQGVKKKDCEYEKHKTEKPVDLMKILISQSTNEGETVIDPFMGNGSTGKGCKELKRKFIGIELGENHYDIAEDRIKNT